MVTKQNFRWQMEGRLQQFYKVLMPMNLCHYNLQHFIGGESECEMMALQVDE